MNTKEDIKNRMIKNAALMWGVPANEIETSFDPIIGLLIAACASEIEKIAGEVNGSQSRITEKLVELMTPGAMNGPSPAHAILYADPIEEFTTVLPEYLFAYRKKLTDNLTSVKYKDLHFSPTKKFNLVNANVRFIATGNKLVENLENKKNQKLTIDLKGSQLNDSALYLGISSTLKVLDFNNISFYFELKGVGNEDLFYHHLRNVICSSENATLNMVAGLMNSNDDNSDVLNQIFNKVSDKTNGISEQIIRRYQKHYLTLQSDLHNVIEKSSFSELENTLEVNDIKYDGAIRWLKIEFSSVISNAVLKNVNCSLNAFPVLNRSLTSFSYALKEFINILPIRTEDLLFDIKSIENIEGQIYSERSKNDSKSEKGTFLLRKNSVAKLDSRKAKEYIIHLIELLKDESASFSFMNNDFLRSNLNTLNQVISLLEKKVSEASNTVDHTNYLSLKPFGAKEHLLVEYWTTNGELANDIKPGSELSNYKGMGIKPRSSFLITTTRGGKDELTTQDCLNSSKRSLLSNDRLVTKEDVKTVCRELYGDKIKKVEIRRSYMKAIDLKKGFIPCMEILLTPNQQSKVEDAEWDSIGSNLLYFLEKNTRDILPYKLRLVG